MKSKLSSIQIISESMNALLLKINEMLEQTYEHLRGLSNI